MSSFTLTSQISALCCCSVAHSNLLPHSLVSTSLFQHANQINFMNHEQLTLYFQSNSKWPNCKEKKHVLQSAQTKDAGSKTTKNGKMEEWMQNTLTSSQLETSNITGKQAVLSNVDCWVRVYMPLPQADIGLGLCVMSVCGFLFCFAWVN